MRKSPLTPLRHDHQANYSQHAHHEQCLIADTTGLFLGLTDSGLTCRFGLRLSLAQHNPWSPSHPATNLTLPGYWIPALPTGARFDGWRDGNRASNDLLHGLLGRRDDWTPPIPERLL